MLELFSIKNLQIFILKGGILMREGLVPTVLGTAVTATGVVLKKKEVAPMIAAGIVGFGLAHVVLGAIDLVEHKK